MTIRKIAQLGEPVLRRVARDITREELRTAEFSRLLDDIVDTLRDADGAGLAAPQIYESVRLVAVEVRSNPRYPQAEAIDLTLLVNPRVTALASTPTNDLTNDNTIQVYEGCLSVPGLRGRVQRPRKVAVEALDPSGNPVHMIWEGFRAAVIQHEVDHLDGVVFLDRVDPQTLTFLREFERYVPMSKRVVDGGEAR